MDPYFNISTFEVHPACPINESVKTSKRCMEKNLWGKVWQMWLAMNKTWCVPNHVLAETGSPAQAVACDHIDFLLVNGDDTFVIMENMRQFLREAWTTDRNDPKSGLASLNHTANLSGPVVGCDDADQCNEIVNFQLSPRSTRLIICVISHRSYLIASTRSRENICGFSKNGFYF